MALNTKPFICVLKKDVEAINSAFTNGSTDIRMNVFTGDEFEELLKKAREDCGLVFGTVRSKKPSLQRYVWSKSYNCTYRHSEGGTKTRCPVSLHVRIKKSTVQTQYKDKCVKEFPCLVSITHAHNHDARRFDDILDSVQNKFQVMVRNYQKRLDIIEALKGFEKSLDNLAPSSVVNALLEFGKRTSDSDDKLRCSKGSDKSISQLTSGALTKSRKSLKKSPISKYKPKCDQNGVSSSKKRRHLSDYESNSIPKSQSDVNITSQQD